MAGFACPFTKPSLPIKCMLYAHTLMAPEALSPTVGLANVYPLFLPQRVVTLWFVWDYYISRGQL